MQWSILSRIWSWHYRDNNIQVVGCKNRECSWLIASQVEVLIEAESTNRDGWINKMLNISMGHKISTEWRGKYRQKECVKYYRKGNGAMDFKWQQIVLVGIINASCHNKQTLKRSLTSTTKGNFSGKKSLKCISEDFILLSDWLV